MTRGDWGRPGAPLGYCWGTAGALLGHCWGTAGALLSNLQLVPWRDNIGDVGLQMFKQVILNKLQLNITKFTNFRLKVDAFSLKTFILFL